MFNKILMIVMMVALSGCATNKFSWTDKTSRVMIDTTGIPVEHFAMIQDALMKSDKFVLIERADKIHDIQKEANKVDDQDVKSKYALWAKKYDIGGVVVAHVQCHVRKPFLRSWKLLCHQYLAVVNPLNGETLALSEGDNEEDTGVGYQYIVPSWEDTTAQLVSHYDAVRNHNKLQEMNSQRVMSSGSTPIGQAATEEAPAPVQVSTPSAPTVSSAPAPEAAQTRAPAAQPTEKLAQGKKE